MEHQDWTPVVLGKKKVESKVPVNNSIKRVFNETKIPDKFTTDFIQEVVTKRNVMNLNRKKLAEKLGESVQRIEWFETGRENYSGEFVSKLKRLFGKFESNPRQVFGKLEE
jgi:ribosome-binding protein aMBF1 (putative translation factor)